MQLAVPLYQGMPSTRILAWNGGEREALRPRPDVGGASEPVLQPAVRAGDHVGVEAGAGHHGEALAVHRRDVDESRPAVQAGADGRRRCPWGSPGWSQAGWMSPSGRSRPSRLSRRACRCTAGPCRLHPRRRSGRRRRAAAFAPASAPSCSSAPRPTGGRSRRACASARRSSGRPPSMVLPAWATTATVVMTSLLAWLGGLRRPRGGDRDDERADADQHPGGDVGRVVHPAVHPRKGDEQGDRDGHEPTRALARRCSGSAR